MGKALKELDNLREKMWDRGLAKEQDESCFSRMVGYLLGVQVIPDSNSGGPTILPI